MKKEVVPYLLLFLISLLVVVAALFFLPDQIPRQFTVGGEVKMASKYFLLLLTPIPPLIVWGIRHPRKR